MYVFSFLESDFKLPTTYLHYVLMSKVVECLLPTPGFVPLQEVAKRGRHCYGVPADLAFSAPLHPETHLKLELSCEASLNLSRSVGRGEILETLGEGSGKEDGKDGRGQTETRLEIRELRHFCD